LSAQIIQFPTSKRMPTRIAEERLGNLIMYRYPSQEQIGEDVFEWLERRLLDRWVVRGWEPVREGIVKAFKSGHVRHLISRVVLKDPLVEGRPYVETCCSLDLYPVFNWNVRGTLVKREPVTVLSMDQSSYFRPCKRCAMREEERIRALIR